VPRLLILCGSRFHDTAHSERRSSQAVRPQAVPVLIAMPNSPFLSAEGQTMVW
jgi:hypothetical protein